MGLLGSRVDRATNDDAMYATTTTTSSILMGNRAAARPSRLASVDGEAGSLGGGRGGIARSSLAPHRAVPVVHDG